jgi:hypothetical protein
MHIYWPVIPAISLGITALRCADPYLKMVLPLLPADISISSVIDVISVYFRLQRAEYFIMIVTKHWPARHCYHTQYVDSNTATTLYSNTSVNMNVRSPAVYWLPIRRIANGSYLLKARLSVFTSYW